MPGLLSPAQTPFSVPPGRRRLCVLLDDRSQGTEHSCLLPSFYAGLDPLSRSLLARFRFRMHYPYIGERLLCTDAGHLYCALVTGMREAAQLVRVLPRRENHVGFWGARDGTFVYGCVPIPGRPTGRRPYRQAVVSRSGKSISSTASRRSDAPEQITDSCQLTSQYVVMADLIS